MGYLAFAMFAYTSLVTGIVTLVLTLGWVSAIAMSMLTFLCTLNVIFGRLSQRQAHDALKEADKRLGIMSEIINGIKAIKLCAWENKFLEHITAARSAETVPIGKQRCLAEISVAIGRTSPNVTSGVCFLCLAVAFPNSSYLRAGAVFAAMNVFLALRTPLILIPETI